MSNNVVSFCKTCVYYVAVEQRCTGCGVDKKHLRGYGCRMYENVKTRVRYPEYMNQRERKD